MYFAKYSFFLAYLDFIRYLFTQAYKYISSVSTMLFNYFTTVVTLDPMNIYLMLSFDIFLACTTEPARQKVDKLTLISGGNCFEVDPGAYRIISWRDWRSGGGFLLNINLANPSGKRLILVGKRLLVSG